MTPRAPVPPAVRPGRTRGVRAAHAVATHGRSLFHAGRRHLPAIATLARPKGGATTPACQVGRTDRALPTCDTGPLRLMRFIVAELADLWRHRAGKERT